MTRPASRARLIASAIAIVVSTSLAGFLVPSLAIEIGRDFELSEPVLGLAVGVFWGAAAIGSVPVGRLVDRLGPDRGVRIAGVVAAAGAAGVAVCDSSVALVSALALGGLANAFALPGATALIARGVQAERQGLALAAQQSAPPLASLLAGLALPLVSALLGWRPAFLAAAAIAVAAAFWVPGQECHGAFRRERQARPGRPIVVLALGAALANASAGALLSFLVVFATEAELSAAAAGLLLAATGLGAALTRLVAGAEADRHHRQALGAVAVLMAAGAVGSPCCSPKRP